MRTTLNSRFGFLLPLLAIFCTALTLAPARATVWDGNGGTGGDFATAVNWAGNVLPGSADLAEINSNSSAANPVTLSSATITVDNINLGASTASFMEVNGGTLNVLGAGTVDFGVGTGAGVQSVFTLSSGTVQFGVAGAYTDGNDLDIGKNGNGKYVQTGGTLMHHADDFKIADSAGGVGLAEVSGGNLFVADGFSISDNAGGTGTLNVSGNAVVVSGNSGGLASFAGTVGEGYISIANRGGNGHLNIAGNATVYGRKLEYVGEPGATAEISVGGNGKLVISAELVTGAEASNGGNVMGGEEGSTGQINVQGSGLLAIDNPTETHFSDGYVLGRNGGSGALSIGGVNARVAVRQRLLIASGLVDLDLDLGDPGSATPGQGSVSISSGGHLAASEVHVGTSGVGVVTQTGGSLTTKNSAPLFAESGIADGSKGEDVFIGSLQGSSGTYNHSGGTLSVGDDFIIGHYGTGVFNQSGTATVDEAGYTVLANEVGSVGTWNMSGGTYTQSFGDLEIGDAGQGTLNFSGGTINVSGYTAVGHRQGEGRLNISGTATLNTPNLKILMGKDGQTTQRGVLSISGDDAHINVADTFTMNESSLGSENKIIAELTTGGITTINVGGTASISRGALEVVSNAGVYKPTAGDQYVLINAVGGWDGASNFASVTTNVTLLRPDDIMLRGTGFAGAGGSANRYELRVTARGDFNADFDVNGVDLAVLNQNFGSVSGTYATGDADQNGSVDGADILTWQRNLGHYPAPSLANVSAVPEPATMALAVLGTVLAIGRRRSPAPRS